MKAADRFFAALAGLTDPEEKRKVIGELFIRLFEEVARERKDARYLVQGTFYPDVIESGTARGGDDQVAPQRRRPARGDGLRARRAAAAPVQGRGPGDRRGARPSRRDRLAPALPRSGARRAIVGEVTPERVEILRAADEIVLEEIRRAGLDTQLWQWFAVLPAVRTVGVMGDERTYAYPIVIRAVTSEDAMTADWARLPYDVLERISSRVINEVPGVNRVAYDVTSKPPGTIEWE